MTRLLLVLFCLSLAAYAVFALMMLPGCAHPQVDPDDIAYECKTAMPKRGENGQFTAGYILRGCHPIDGQSVAR